MSERKTPDESTPEDSVEASEHSTEQHKTVDPTETSSTLKDAEASDRKLEEDSPEVDSLQVSQDTEVAETTPSDLDSEPEPEPEPKREPEAAAPVTPEPAKPKGRFLAFLALLLALAAAGGVGYLYYELVYLQPMAKIATQSQDLEQRYTSLQTQLKSQIEAVESTAAQTIAEVRNEQSQRLAENEEAVLKSLNEALNTAPPSQREWKLAEAEYLLRIANHRVLMEQDSVGALSLLQSADQILAELDDFALYQVRARLADEIIALRQVPRDDLQGLYLRIEALKSQVDNLPLPTPEYLSKSSEQPAELSVWQTMLNELKQFVRIRTLASDESLKPLLAPDEVRYLELNLRLALEQAQLATLKRQQDVYEQSLLNVRAWLVDHADPSDARTQAMLKQVDELTVIELALPLPEISGGLNELLSIRRGES